MRFLTVVMLVLLLAVVAMAQEPKGAKACPADHAVKQGFDAFGAFHEVMAPAWHTYYPAKELDSLMAAAPKFDTLFIGIANIEPTMKNVRRKAAFLNNREEFAHLVKAFSEAARAGLKDSVYALMPSVHEAFENTGAALSPYEYPELTGATITLGLIVEKHIPANNMEGITGSTETLMEKVASLNEKTIPEDLKDQQDALLKEFDAISKLAADLKASFDKKDMATYKRVADNLSTKLQEVEATYL